MQSVTRMVPALVVALLAGFVRSLQLYAPQVVARQGVDASQLAVILPAMGLLAVVLSPVGTAITGYLWGLGADVRAEWARFTLGAVLAALAGFGVGTLLMVSLLLGTSAAAFPAVLGQVGYSVIAAIGLVGVGLVALAGGAIAAFRRPA
jgi:hypothetical protein